MLKLAELVPDWSPQEIAEADQEGKPKKLEKVKKVWDKITRNPNAWEQKFFEMGLNRDEFSEHLRPPTGLTSVG